MTPSRVYIVNRSSHDFSAAEQWGELVFMTDGPINRFSVTDMHRSFSEAMALSDPEDWILLTGLPVMNCVACALFAAKHHRLNLLLFKQDHYVERKVML